MEELNEQTNEQPTNDYNAYIKEINNLKSNTVAKAEYEALREERNALIQNLVNGQTVSTEAKPEPVDINALRKNLFKPEKELNDVEYVSRALELRKAIMESEGRDIFVGSSHSLTPEQSDYDKAQRVADVLEQCLEESNGNNTKFIANLQSRMQDTFIPGKRR